MLSSNTSAVSGDANYIEDVFSTYLYTGNSSTQTITNNIDLSTEGGLVWLKSRNDPSAGGAIDHRIFDTARGVNKYLSSAQTSAQATATTLTAFNTTGFALGSNAYVNESSKNLVSWTFRKQPKFFDVVTYTGNDTTQNIAHSLGSTPGCVIIKRTDGAASWYVWHRGQSAGYYSILNTTAAQTNANNTITFGSNTTYVDPTSTQFTVGSNGNVNGLNNTYVAYLFAHNAGGFGLTGTDNVISCGSYTGNGTSQEIANLGFEPQWWMIKSTSTTGNWTITDTMRGAAVTSSSDRQQLQANLTNAETNATNPYPTATGLYAPAANLNASGQTYIYIAIRRGPMKVPTDGTTVFYPYSYAGNSGTSTVDFSFSPDTFIGGVINRASFLINMFWDRIRGKSLYLQTSDSGGTAAEVTDTATVTAINQFGVTLGSDNKWNGPYNYIMYALKRAPGFYDEVCYTGTGSSQTQTHNLGATPEMMIVKCRSATGSWPVYSSALGANKYVILNGVSTPSTNTTTWNNTAPTSTVFSVGSSDQFINASGSTYVAYLFATCAGVSKVGSYTGTGTTKQVDCGFSAGARFVLIKRTDSIGDWYCWDTARGIVSGNDPYNLWNVAAAQVTTTDYIDPYSAGFEISSTAPAAINASGGTYIYLAIA